MPTLPHNEKRVVWGTRRRIEEDRPLFLNRIADYTETERELAIRAFEEGVKKVQQELDDLLAGSHPRQAR
jgi:hypothetical protein